MLCLDGRSSARLLSICSAVTTSTDVRNSLLISLQVSNILTLSLSRVTNANVEKAEYALDNKKAVLSQENRAMPQLFFLV